MYNGARAGTRDEEPMVAKIRGIVSLEISNLILAAWDWNSAVSVTSSGAGRFVCGVLVMRLKLLCSPRAGLLDDGQHAATSRERYGNSESRSGS